MSNLQEGHYSLFLRTGAGLQQVAGLKQGEVKLPILRRNWTVGYGNEGIDADCEGIRAVLSSRVGLAPRLPRTTEGITA